MTDLIKIGCNVAGLGVAITLLGLIPKLDTPDKLIIGSLSIALYTSLFKINTRN
jgi:hypothetical protein